VAGRLSSPRCKGSAPFTSLAALTFVARQVDADTYIDAIPFDRQLQWAVENPFSYVGDRVTDGSCGGLRFAHCRRLVERNFTYMQGGCYLLGHKLVRWIASLPRNELLLGLLEYKHEDLITGLLLSYLPPEYPLARWPLTPGVTYWHPYKEPAKLLALHAQLRRLRAPPKAPSPPFTLMRPG
jgi:hypothetical protein